ncbi:DUF262 domain-containing protein [Tissierella praeacuta]|uniref:DUF262 domain-containing protein n=1 Tax=Tissierella praeacuta TaxID=43131 RepID=UPI003DA2B4AF
MSNKSFEEKQNALREIEEQKKKIDYDIRDFTIGYIVQEFSNDRFFIPGYQREFVWNVNMQSRFIESILLGLPIPMLFLGLDKETGNFEIVDGAQRIQTLVAFGKNELILRNLRKLTSINSYCFKDLPSKIQRVFENTALRMVVLEERTTLETRQEIFNRINTSGVQAAPTEIRMGAYDGPFTEFIKRCAMNELFIKLCPLTPGKLNRKEDYELLFRFFAYSDRYDDYDGKPAPFISKYVSDNQEEFDEKRLECEFNRMLEFVDKYFPYGFARSKTSEFVPRTRFEAISIGVNLALRQNPNLKIQNVDWIDSDEFSKVTTTDGANNKKKLFERVDFVKNKLLVGE